MKNCLKVYNKKYYIYILRIIYNSVKYILPSTRDRKVRRLLSLSYLFLNQNFKAYIIMKYKNFILLKFVNK